MKSLLSRCVVSLGLVIASTGQTAPEPWRVQASQAAHDLADRIEILDATLHEVYDSHGTPEFKKAIEDIHHIEELVLDFASDILSASFPSLCHGYDHLYHDLVNIRSYLIELNLQSNPQVVKDWNSLIDINNNSLLPYFRTCPNRGGGRVIELL